jgi:hypothetical protein
MPTLALDVATKVGKLLRLLSSTNDGEALGAARSISRVLQSAGADFHALATAVEDRSSRSDKKFSVIYARGIEDGMRRAAEMHPAQSDFYDIDGGKSAHQMALFCQERADRLTEREAEFIGGVAARTVWREPTAKQAKWLRSIYLRLGGRP